MPSIAEEIASKLSEKAIGDAETEDVGEQVAFDEFSSAMAESDPKKAREALKSFVEITLRKIN